MTDETTNTVPAEETQPDNTVSEPQEAKQPEVKENQPPVEQDNLIAIPADKLVDYKRKLHGSKEEALRLKAEKERLEAEVAALKNPQYQYSSQDVEALKVLAKQAGIPLREDYEQLQHNTYKQEADEATQAFLKAHPEYANIGDPKSDDRWEALQSEINSYIAPSRGRDYASLLEKAHRNLNYNPELERERGKSLGMAQARIQPQSMVGGGNVSKSAPKAPKEKQAVLEGFKSVRPEAFITN